MRQIPKTLQAIWVKGIIFKFKDSNVFNDLFDCMAKQ